MKSIKIFNSQHRERNVDNYRERKILASPMKIIGEEKKT